MLRRRLRGLFGMTLLGTVAWAGLGFLIGAVIQLRLLPGVDFTPGPTNSLGPIDTLTLLGAFVGAVNGLTFAILMATAERGRSVMAVRSWRVALWNALGTGVGLRLFLQSTPLLVVVGAAMGALTSVGLLHLARRGKSLETPPAGASATAT